MQLTSVTLKERRKNNEINDNFTERYHPVAGFYIHNFFSMGAYNVIW